MTVDMKKIVYLLSAAALMLVCSCAEQQPQYANRAEKILAEINDPNSDYVVVISHRG